MFVFVERMAAAEGPDFAARVSTPEALMTIGAPAQAIRASRTVREALVRVANTFHLLASHMFGQAHAVAGGMELAVSIPIGGTAEMHHQAQQHTAAFVSCLGRLVNGRPLSARVEIAPHPSLGIEHLKPFLGEDVVPGTPVQLRMRIPDSALDLELPPSMLQLPCPEEVHLGPIGCSSLGESARVLVAGMIADGCPSLDRLAFEAGRSRRTLQRLLAAEGSSFAALLDGVRQAEALILGCAWVATAGHAQSNADQARALLKAMSDYVGALQTIEASVDTSVEIVTPEMEKVAFTSTSHLKAVRPDKLHIERRGGYADVEFLFDGKTLSVRDRNSRAYAQLPLQADMDGLIEAVHAQLGLGAPGTDLLLRDSYSVLVADVMEAKYIGQGVVAGQMCDHVAFRNFDTDWQLWIRQGAEKAPCKMIITSKTVGMAPQYTTHVRSWKGNARIPAGAFQFRPAPGEQRLELSQLTGIDEVPPPASKEGPK